MFASCLDAAIRYADIGWYVHPCRANKTPLTEHGLLDATTDREQIVAWWRKWPNADVGIDCGRSGIVAIDLDFDNVKGIDGPSFFSRLEDEHGPAWCELAASTPRGGRHLIYKMPDPPVGNRTNAIPKSGIDVRGAGGYFIAPSPASPAREWIIGDPDESELTDVPEWIEREILGGARHGTAAKTRAPAMESGTAVVLLPEQIDAIRRALLHIDPDPRDTWIRVGMALKSTGAREVAYGLWCDWSRDSPKFDERVQRRQWDSLREFFRDGREVTLGTLFHLAGEGGYVGVEVDLLPAEPVEVDPTPTPVRTKIAFPRDLMNVPGLVGDIAEWMLSCSRRPQPALCLASSIVTVGAIIGRRVATPTDLRTNVYALGLGGTGSGKDAGVRLPHLLLTRAGLEQFIGPGEWKSDTGMRAALIDHPSHAAYVDEFCKVLEQMSGDHVAPHLRGVKRHLLDLYSASNSVHHAPAYADRRLNEPITLQQPNLGIYGTGTPDEMFSSLDRGAIKDGFLNRMLLFWADDAIPMAQQCGRAEPPVELVERVKLLEQRTRLGDLGDMATAAPAARIIPMTAQATELWVAIDLENDARRRELQAVHAPEEDLWARFSEHVAKFALIRSVGDDPDREIDVEDVAWARDLVCWSTVRTCAEADGRVADSSYEAAVQRVRRVVSAAGSAGIRQADLTRRTQWLARSQRRDILASLIEAGQVEQIVSEVTRPGRGKVALTVFRSTDQATLQHFTTLQSDALKCLNDPKMSTGS